MSSTADWYREFAGETRGHSPAYELLASAVAEDSGLIALLETLPEPKRQPNLLFAAARLLGGPVTDPEAFLAWAPGRRDELTDIMLVRHTQTNEPGRCATLLPVLAALPQPLALLEVGPSAGLCLYPDAYRYHYLPDGHQAGPTDSPVELECAVSGPAPLPSRVPEVVWRAGLDLNPLDITSEEDLRWLEALVWPDQPHRAARLRAAAGIARHDPPLLVRGDLLTDLPELAAQAPADATLVIFHTAVLYYVPESNRRAFASIVSQLPGHWISNEGVNVMPGLSALAPPPPREPAILLALDGKPLAYAGAHGQWLHWLSPGSPV